jgi:2-oxoglutarate ferredoxin oxidoreductase subunit alpha
MKRGFDLADKYRNPVMILGDGMLGQIMEPLKVPEVIAEVKNFAKPWALTGAGGREPNVVKSFFMREGDLETSNLKLQKKYSVIQKKEMLWQDYLVKDASVVLVAYGSIARIAKAAVDKLREKGKKVGLIRPITLWPFPKEAFKVLKKEYLVVEMSYGQMLEDVLLSVNGKAPVDFLGCAGGGVPKEEEIINKLNKIYHG